MLHKHEDAVRLLLRQGARTAIRNHWQQSARELARHDGLDAIARLIDGKDASDAELIGGLALLAAIEADDNDEAERLIAADTDVDRTAPVTGGPDDAYTALAVAARAGNALLARLLPGTLQAAATSRPRQGGWTSGSPAAMQLYNEWLHQLVMLRDALLPFANWRDVPLPVRSDGLRRLDRAREAFLAELTTRRARHTAIVGFARAAATGTAGPDGYGFSTPLGTALPEAAMHPDEPASRLPLWTANSGGGPETAAFVSTIDDYAAERSDAASLLGAADEAAQGAGLTGNSSCPRPPWARARRSR